MVVEDTFVTTLESNEALQRVQALLAARGFKSPPQTSIPIQDNGWTTLEMTRGKKRARPRYCAVDCPQRFRIEWDRGRITLANSMETYRKPKAPHKELAMAVATSIEDLLARQTPFEDCERTLAELETRIRRAHRRRLIWAWSIAGVLIAGMIALVVLAANSR